MKILVIDDQNINLMAAKAQLADHEVITISNYDDAQGLVAQKHDFDMVLVDLLMPASKQCMGPKGERFIGEEMPVGIFLAMLAAKNGARYVGMLTDSNHHNHPASACLDAFNKRELRPTPFKIANAEVLLTNNGDWVRLFFSQNLAEMVAYDHPDANKAIRAKYWKGLHDYLVNGPEPEPVRDPNVCIC